jgi:hypothetical protein
MNLGQMKSAVDPALWEKAPRGDPVDVVPGVVASQTKKL